MAKTIAETAIDSCKVSGYSVSAVVVDRAGEVIVALRGDNAGPHTMENARRKAYTARSFRTSTADYAKRFADNDPVVRRQVTLPNVIAIPGGLPIRVGDDVIGGAAASGSPGVDEPCVERLGTLAVHGEWIADIALAEPEQGDSSYAGGVPTTLISPKAGLSARGINFRYSDNEPRVIADFDFDVAPGECVAIAGPSGAGKTTLLKILAGLLRPTTGAVLIDDVPLQAIGLEAYRAQIGCVLQDDRLFAGSIAENIAGFSPSPDPHLIQQVARFAAVHEEILRMPMGYETLVGDMGSSLSGGQMQRIVLARALYRGPRILLLDEATSHLDEENERAINEAIRRLPISRVIVAHRRSTLDMADRIVPIWPAALAAKRVG
jgi:ABC-type multidrug transport system fused ATPase/permease subunit